jgi:cleavage and polyadenylation specificity factor subunit 2
LNVDDVATSSAFQVAQGLLENKEANKTAAQDPTVTKALQPTKLETVEVDLEIKAKTMYVDFEGLADGRAIQNCISNVKPRKLILIHGTEETTSLLAAFVQKQVTYCEAVFTPKALHCIDIESDTNVYKIKLQEKFYQELRFHRVGKHEVAYVHAHIQLESASDLPMLLHHPEDMEDESALNRFPLTLSEGAVKLDKLKQILSKAGFQSEFRAGMLVCADGVVLKRSKTNKLVVEGSLSESYYKIRALVYGQYNFV